MYYPCSENKGADQLRGYREADLRLCFRICRLLVFPRDGSNFFFRAKAGVGDGADKNMEGRLIIIIVLIMIIMLLYF